MPDGAMNIFPEPTKLMRESSDLLFRIPIFLSHPNRLNPTQQQFVDAIIMQIKTALLFPRTLPVTEQYPEPTFTDVRRVVLSSYGEIALNLRQRLDAELINNLGTPIEKVEWVGSAFAQIEPAMGYQYGLPLLLIRETGVEQSGIWSFGIAPFIILEWDPDMPMSAFFESNQWKEIFQNWAAQVRNGYYIQTQPEFQYSCSQGDIVR